MNGCRSRASHPDRRRLTGLAGLTLAALLVAGCGGVAPAARAQDALKAGMNAQAAQDLDGAARDYREALHAQPRNVYAYYNLALVFEEQSDPSRAEYYYRIALGLDPDFVPALMNLARLQAELGQTEDALGLTLRVSKIYPDYAPPLMRQAALYEALGRTEDAAGARAAALAIDAAITEEAANAKYGPADTGSIVMQAEEQLATK